MNDRTQIVTTTSGDVKGLVVQGVSVFKRIRYGADTGGENRFLPPKPATPAAGVFDALAYGEMAVQGLVSPSGSEDCLFLNIWTPGTNDRGRRPVMVWLHGGGFASGSGSAPMYDGVNLCTREDVVVVTINHRLGVLSATDLSEALGDEYAESGCAGMLDIVAALEWVRTNIEAFGGDPGRVMVFGESGGGRKVSILLAMPAASGLFHAAVIQSGAILRVVTAEDGIRRTESLLDELGLSASEADMLQTVPVNRLMKASQAANGSFLPSESVVGMIESTPVINPISLPAHPFDPVAAPFSSHVPVIAGHNRTEETLFYRVGQLLYPQVPDRDMDFDLTEEELVERMDKRLAVDSRELIAAYREENPRATPWDLQMLIQTDYPRGVYPRELALRRAALHGAPGCVYRFDWEMDDEVRAFHALEIPFVFHNTGSSPWTKDHRDSPERLAAALSAAWAEFARSGEPKAGGLPEWLPYDESRHTMLFNNPSQLVVDPNSRSRTAMERVLGLS